MTAEQIDLPPKGWPYPDAQTPAASPSVQPSPLAAALAKAQAAFAPILREKTVKVTMKSGGSYTFSYAPLEAILHAVMPALSANGLALTQNVSDASGKEVVRTELMHANGESISNAVRVMASESGPQAYGSALTYARRYGITLLLCVCADDDDDGNAAEGNQAVVTKANPDNGRIRHDPPDGNPNYSIAERNKYVSRFNDAFDMDADELEIAKAVKSIHEEISHKHDLYIAVGEGLGTRKNAIRRNLDLLKKVAA